MAARSNAASQLSLYVVVFVCLFIISFGLAADRISLTEHSYFSFAITMLEFILTFTFSIPPEILLTPATTGGNTGPAKRRWWQRERKQKRGNTDIVYKLSGAANGEVQIPDGNLQSELSCQYTSPHKLRSH